jgi:chemotaxis protein MotA
MNFNTIFSFIIAIAVLFIGLKLATDDIIMFWDIPSVFIVLGGTFAAAAISFQLSRVVQIFKIFVRRMLFGKGHDIPGIIKEVVMVSEAYVRGDSMKAIKDNVKDHFLKEALGMMEDGVIKRDEMLEIMAKRNENLAFNYMEEANKIKTLGKFPPAFGMIGTTIGMVVLLGNLGGEDAMKRMGPAMAVCLITTLYGSVVSNLALNPIAENLIDNTKETFHKNKVIIEGIKLIMEKQNPILIIEKLNSFLIPSQRLDWKTVVKRS